MPDDRDAMKPGGFLLRRKAASLRHVHAQHVEECRRYAPPHDLLRVLGGIAEIGVPPFEGDERLERPGLPRPVEVVRRRHAVALVVLRLVRLEDLYHAVKIRRRQRAEQQRVDHREHGAVRAEPDGQRQNDNQREPRLAQQHARGVAQILEDAGHG
jgi:hypothetical protein